MYTRWIIGTGPSGIESFNPYMELDRLVSKKVIMCIAHFLADCNIFSKPVDAHRNIYKSTMVNVVAITAPSKIHLYISTTVSVSVLGRQLLLL